VDNKLFFSTHTSNTLYDKIVEERSTIGFYDLPGQDIGDIEAFAKRNSFKDIVVVGIGGSSLGTSAVYNFLKSTHEFSKRLHFLDTTDPIVLRSRLNEFNPEEALFCIISKSGTTIETVAVLKYLQKIVPISSKNYIVITDNGSKLEKLALHYHLKVFHIPDNVGGRFSVLSSVGLVPLALIGVDIASLLRGADNVRDSFFSEGEYCKTVLTKATYYAQMANTYNINCLFSYSETFREFNDWYIQLWGESLGKQQLHSELHVGLTPVGLIGPTDQHSFLQLIVDGKRDKSVTVIKVNAFEDDLKIPDISLPFLDGLDMLNEREFSSLITMQADALIESLEAQETIPLDVIEINKVDAYRIGELMYYYELLTALVAKMLDINAYDQPGVEHGKQILKKKLA
jgi:glucose-6-phosphate isomerase